MHLDYRERSMRAFQLVLSLEAIIELHLRAIARIAKQHGNAPWKRRQRLKINRAARFTSSDKALYPDFSDRAACVDARVTRAYLIALQCLSFCCRYVIVSPRGSCCRR